MIKKIYPPFILLFCLGLSACASNAGSQEMTYIYQGKQKLKNPALHENIAIGHVSGGSETNPLWESDINDANFQQALQSSLEFANLSQELSRAGYQLDAKLIRLNKPLFGFNMTSTCEILYSVKDVKTGKLIYTKKITTSFTATASDSLVGVVRLQKANEGAGRSNIQKLIEDLYQLPKRK